MTLMLAFLPHECACKHPKRAVHPCCHAAAVQEHYLHALLQPRERPDWRGWRPEGEDDMEGSDDGKGSKGGDEGVDGEDKAQQHRYGLPPDVRLSRRPQPTAPNARAHPPACKPSRPAPICRKKGRGMLLGMPSLSRRSAPMPAHQGSRSFRSKVGALLPCCAALRYCWAVPNSRRRAPSAPSRSAKLPRDAVTGCFAVLCLAFLLVVPCAGTQTHACHNCAFCRCVYHARQLLSRLPASRLQLSPARLFTRSARRMSAPTLDMRGLAPIDEAKEEEPPSGGHPAVSIHLRQLACMLESG